MATYLFIFFAVLAIAAAVAMVISKSTINSALFLVINMLAVAGVYLLLKAQFLAVVQVLVYGGAIMVLFLFVIMLLNIDDENSLFESFSIKYMLAFFLSVAVLAQLLYVIAGWTGTLPVMPADMIAVGTVEALGDELFTTYLLPFEVTAILLTAAVVGAIYLAQHKREDITQ